MKKIFKLFLWLFLIILLLLTGLYISRHGINSFVSAVRNLDFKTLARGGLVHSHGEAHLLADEEDCHVYLGGYYTSSGTHSVVNGYAETASLTPSGTENTFRSEIWITRSNRRGRILNVSDTPIKVTLTPVSREGTPESTPIVVNVKSGTFSRFVIPKGCSGALKISYTCNPKFFNNSENESSVENANLTTDLSEDNDAPEGVYLTGTESNDESTSNEDISEVNTSISNANIFNRIWVETEDLDERYIRINMDWNYDVVRRMNHWLVVFFYDETGYPILERVVYKGKLRKMPISVYAPIGGPVYDREHYRDYGIRMRQSKLAENTTSRSGFCWIVISENPDGTNPIYRFKTDSFPIF